MSRTTFVSLFSGAGGLDLGLEAAGWTCVAQVEWDAQCQRVLRRHWPDVPKWGDVATVHGAELPPADLVAFGSPCQDLSVAGPRHGFADGTRSVLFYEGIRIIAEMREATGGRHPTWALWENVAGALSSAGGRDFAAVLDELARVGAVDICWRMLDARHFGVPQRRRRVFVVADFGGERAGQVLLEPEGVRRNPDQGNQAGSCPPGGARGGAAAGGIYSPAAFGQYERERESVVTLRARDAKASGVPVVVNALDAQGGARTTTPPRPGTSSSVGTLMAKNNGGGWRIGADEAAAGQLVVVHE